MPSQLRKNGKTVKASHLLAFYSLRTLSSQGPIPHAPHYITAQNLRLPFQYGCDKLIGELLWYPT